MRTEVKLKSYTQIQNHTQTVQFTVYILNISFLEKTKESTVEKVINQWLFFFFFKQPGSSSLWFLFSTQKAHTLRAKTEEERNPRLLLPVGQKKKVNDKNAILILKLIKDLFWEDG